VAAAMPSNRVVSFLPPTSSAATRKRAAGLFQDGRHRVRRGTGLVKKEGLLAEPFEVAVASGDQAS
jgi:hypothetical protein